MEQAIKIGSVVTATDTEYQILSYDRVHDQYRVDIFNLAGNLIFHDKPIDGDLLRTLFKGDRTQSPR